MNIATHTPKSRIITLRLLVILLITVTVYAIIGLQKSAAVYDGISETISKEPTIAKTVTIGEKTIKIPSYDMFETGQIWALVSKKHPLKGEAGYKLVDIPVAHGDKDRSMKVAQNITDELERLVNAADADGEPLMVSSAYRSLEEQQATYDAFVKKNGKELAAVYVSPVGASEHHTGLSVDFSSLSDECAEDSDTCSLSQSGAAWLAKNATKYGFIQRYPAGEQEVTGVGYEPWHYRFVGIPLAQAMATTDLTFDQVVAKLAPGYAQAK